MPKYSPHQLQDMARDVLARTRQEREDFLFAFALRCGLTIADARKLLSQFARGNFHNA